MISSNTATVLGIFIFKMSFLPMPPFHHFSSTYEGSTYEYSYCYSYSGYNYYLPSLIMMGVVTPILSLAHMIVFSINCSYIWNEMSDIAIKSMHQGLPLRTINLGNGAYPDQLPYYGTFPVPSNGEQAPMNPQGHYYTSQKAFEAQQNH
jgi:hypothetical protein